MNILIADDHDIFRQSLALLLESRSIHKIVGHVASFTELHDQVINLAPDCILLDYHMPGGDPMKISDSLRRSRPDIKIIMLTGAQSPAIVRQLTAHTFDGVLHKRDDAEVILTGIERIAAGGRYLSPSVSNMAAEITVDLTQREIQVLSQFMQGKAPNSIAEALNISVRTVEKHKENMMKKLEVTSSIQLVEAGHRLMLDQ